MINANELRVGNWVEVIRVAPVQVTPDHIKAIMSGDDTYYPIPLTPEILEKAQFKLSKSGKTYFMENDCGDTIMISHNTASIGGNDSCTGGHFYCASVEYVHQLQNLYFALTGAELTIDL